MGIPSVEDKEHNMSKLLHSHWVSILTASLVAILTFGVLLVMKPAFTTMADNPEPDSNFIASGPVMNQQTLEANLARGDQLEQQDNQLQKDQTDGLYGPMPAKDPTNAHASNQLQPTIVAEILHDFNIPSGWGQLYDIENMWHGPVSDHRISVYAGLLYDGAQPTIAASTGQGLVIVLDVPTQANTEGSFQQYFTPSKTGPVHITAFSGTCLTLVSANNTTYIFDIATRQWSCGTTQAPPP